MWDLLFEACKSRPLQSLFKSNVCDSDAQVLFGPGDVGNVCSRGAPNCFPFSTVANRSIDSAFTVKSHRAGLIQVADVFAYLLRRYCGLKEMQISPSRPQNNVSPKFKPEFS